MIVSHRQIYNPKIDFVICRVLLNYLPSSYDVARLQACFEKHTSPTEVFERQIVAIRDYFAANDICTSTRRSIKELFNIVTGEVIDLINLDLNRNLTLSGVCELVRVIEQINPVDKLSLFKILILTKYCDGKRVPIIPYHSHSKNRITKLSKVIFLTLGLCTKAWKRELKSFVVDTASKIILSLCSRCKLAQMNF